MVLASTTPPGNIINKDRVHYFLISYQEYQYYIKPPFAMLSLSLFISYYKVYAHERFFFFSSGAVRPLLSISSWHHNVAEDMGLMVASREWASAANVLVILR